MMIAALAKAARVLGEEKYLRAAQSARLFLKTRLTAGDGRLRLRWRDRKKARPPPGETTLTYMNCLII